MAEALNDWHHWYGKKRCCDDRRREKKPRFDCGQTAELEACLELNVKDVEIKAEGEVSTAFFLYQPEFADRVIDYFPVVLQIKADVDK